MHLMLKGNQLAQLPLRRLLPHLSPRKGHQRNFHIPERDRVKSAEAFWIDAPCRNIRLYRKAAGF